MGVLLTEIKGVGQNWRLAPSRSYFLHWNCGDIRLNEVESGTYCMDWPAWIEALGALATAAFTLVLAFATIRLWNSTSGLHEETKRLAGLAEAQSNDMKASITIAQRAAEVAEKTLIASDRPWVRIDPEIAGELIFGTDDVSIPIRVTLKNIGKSPAFNVRFYCELYGDITVASKNARDCVHNRFSRLVALGDILFPDDEINYPRLDHLEGIPLTMALDAFKQTIVDMETSLSEENGPDRSAIDAMPAILFIATYEIPSDRSAWKHYTIMCSQLGSREHPAKGWDGSPAVIFRENLLLRQFMTGYVT
jgi:hypothetical protein